MSSFPDGQRPSPSQAIPLGRLLVARGLLTEQQLIEGLLEQDRTGDRLGKVLIRLGYVDAPSVAMALASQHGGPLKTEYGFATGFGSNGSTEPPVELLPGSASMPPLTDLRLADRPGVSSPTGPEPVETKVTEASPETPSAAMPAPAVTGHADEIAGTPDDNAPNDPKASPAEQALGPIDAMIAERDAALAELDAAQTRIADLEGELAAARAQLDERHSKTAELEARVAGARLAAEAAVAALRGVAEVPS